MRFQDREDESPVDAHAILDAIAARVPHDDPNDVIDLFRRSAALYGVLRPLLDSVIGKTDAALIASGDIVETVPDAAYRTAAILPFAERRGAESNFFIEFDWPAFEAAMRQRSN